jgi:hypothetical protein
MVQRTKLKQKPPRSVLQCMSLLFGRESDIIRSRLDFRFRGKNGHAADITGYFRKQCLAIGRAEFDDVGAAVLRAADHDRSCR